MRLKNRDRFDAVMLLIYTLLVYVWSLNLYPLGRDFAVLAQGGSGLPPVAEQLFAFEMALFGTFLPGYHAVNILLLYLCTLGVYRFVNATLRGFWWLGTFAAVIFMANPVHTEAVANVSGIGDLVPCLAALIPLVLYAEHVRAPRRRVLAAALIAFGLAVFAFVENVYLVLVILLLELLVTERRHWGARRIALFAATGAAAVLFHWTSIRAAGFDPAASLASLYLVFYPIGLLPETVHVLRESLWWAAAATAGAAFVLTIIWRKTGSPAFLFGILGMVALRLYPGSRPVDPVHMLGGGQLLLANAFFVLAVAAMLNRILEHLKWRKTVVWLTTIGGVVMFALQVSAIFAWRDAGQHVRSFQKEAQVVAKEGSPLLLCPAFTAYGSAPMALSESISHNTPFSTAIEHKVLLPLRYYPPEEMTLTGGQIPVLPPMRIGFRLNVEGKSAVQVDPFPYAAPPAQGVHVELLESTQSDCVFVVESPVAGKVFPGAPLPMGK